MKANEIVQTQQEGHVELLQAALSEVAQEYGTFRMQMEERLSGLDQMMARDSFGWTPLSGQESEQGPSLLQLKRRSAQLRQAITLEPTMLHGARLLSTYIWSDPIRYDNVPGLRNGSPVGRGKTDVGRYVKDEWNQNEFFGPVAQQKRERALFTDGGYFVLGDDATKKLRVIPLTRISAVYCDPDYQDDIWAYRLSWWHMQLDGTQGEEVVEWVYTDQHKSEQTDSINYNGNLEPVSTGKTFIDGWVNQQIGWRFGFPIGGSVLEWVGRYNEFMRAGMEMNSAMASIWATAKKEAAAGVQNVAAKIAAMTGSGNTAVGTTELAPLATAGRAYDFGAGIPILSRVAAGLGLSVVALSSSPGDAGSSYGAAATLDLPSRVAIESHRLWACAFDERVLRFLGARDAVANFPPLTDAAEMYRLKQAAQLDWNSGLYGSEEAKVKFEAAEGNRGEIAPPPTGVMLPNNEESILRRDIDPNSSGSATPAQGAPGQGVSTGVGDVPADDSTRDDNTI